MSGPSGPEAQAALAAACAEVLEKMAFLFSEEAGREESARPEGRVLTVGLDFKGIWRGRVELQVPWQLGLQLAANVLGVEAEDEAAEARAEDALKELLNVITGHLLSSLAGTAPVFDLGAPQAGEAKVEEWEAWLGEAGTVALLVEEQPVLARLRIQSETN